MHNDHHHGGGFDESEEDDGLLNPKWIHNVSCFNPMLIKDPDYFLDSHLGWSEAIRFLILLLNSVLALACQTAFLRAMSRGFKWIETQPKIIIGSLSICHIFSEITVLIFGLYPALFNCWPFGKAACRIQVKKKASVV